MERDGFITDIWSSQSAALTTESQLMHTEVV